MTETGQFGIERTRDRLEITHRVHQFCRGVDRLDLELARGAFHPDAIDNHGVTKGSVDDLMAWIAERHKSVPFSYHHVGNIFIEFVGPDDAMCESYVLTWQSAPEADGAPGGGERVPEMLAAGRYVDHFSRRHGEWRIQTRVSFPESVGLIEFTSNPFVADPGWAHGTRDADDPSQVLRQELGL
jgi:hypothetical protein